MQFTLSYRGPLKANGSPQHKQELRSWFHRQLAILWDLEPLSGCARCRQDSPPAGKLSLVCRVGGLALVPLVSSRLHLVAELDITYLRAEPAGRIFLLGGDIDNRLKTLLDALAVPRPEQIPGGAALELDEAPLLCILEDDSLVTRVSVTTDQLLEPGQPPNDVLLLVRVTTRATQCTLGNIGLA